MFSDNLIDLCLTVVVERRISNDRVDVARNLSSRLSSAGSTHPPEAKNDFSRLSCADSIRPPEAKNYFLSSAGGRNTMTGPTGLRFSGSSAGKIRVRACALSRCGQNPGLGLGLGLALASLERTFMPSAGGQELFRIVRRRPRTFCSRSSCAGFLVRRRPFTR